MPVQDIAGEATRAVGYASLGAVALKGIELALKTLGVTRSLHATDLSQTMKIAADLREELRKDNEDLRERVTDLETHLESLERALHDVRAANEALRYENATLKAQARAMVKT